MPSPRGVTLLELLVVLVLIGLVAALTAPALLREPAPAAGAAGAAATAESRLTAYARGAAVRRGETLALDVAPDGRWTLRVAHGDTLPLDAGTLDARPAAPRRLLVTPLGLCLPDDDERVADASWDAGACRP